MAALGFIAILSGWIVTEQGRQPLGGGGAAANRGCHVALAGWTVGLSLTLFVVVYAVIFATGIHFMNRLIVRGPDQTLIQPPARERPTRPIAAAHGEGQMTLNLTRRRAGGHDHGMADKPRILRPTTASVSDSKGFESLSMLTLGNRPISDINSQVTGVKEPSYQSRERREQYQTANGDCPAPGKATFSFETATTQEAQYVNANAMS